MDPFAAFLVSAAANLVPGLIVVIVGIPIGLALNRRAVRFAEQ
jgi:hypothetical protein